MNLSAAIMLVDETVRPLKVEYDPETKANNNPMRWFKTINPDIKVGNLVVVQTHTRHGFTVAKVTEVDFAVDFESSEPWGWCADIVDKRAFDRVLEIETGVKNTVAKANENKMREELKANMGLGTVTFDTSALKQLAGHTVDIQPAPVLVAPAPAPDVEEFI